MSWILLSLGSALLLGFYDLAKKHALRENAVLPVLFFGVLTSGLIWLPFTLWSGSSPDTFPSERFYVHPLTVHQHLLLFLKSALVAFSWIFGYFAIKHLPLSIAGPIRATSPFWTILLAVFFMGEQPSPSQWLGITIVMVAFYAFSFIGKREGIHFHRDKWVGFMVVATLIGACSAIYDKFLLQNAALSPATVQAWFSIYLVAVMLPFYLVWKNGKESGVHFQWRWSIPLIGILLLAADFLYFSAISQSGALISIISPIRRTAVIVSFLGAILIHKEVNFRLKALCLGVLLVGVLLIKLTTH